MRVVMLFGLVGCTAELPESLTVEPAQIDLAVELDAAAPSVALHVERSGEDVTADAAFSLSRPLGTIADATLTSDGLTGGTATLTITVGALVATVPVTAHVHGRRGASADPFATAVATPVDAHLDPADGAVLPSALGRMVVSFAAADTDDLHRLHAGGPYLDLEVVEASTQAIELTASEWGAIARTGGDVELTLASLSSAAPATQRVATAHVAIADLAPHDILAGGTLGPLGATNIPSLWRYDMRAGAAAPLFASPPGTCLGCHIAVSPDGSRIAAGTFASNAFAGLLFDVRTGAVLARAPAADPWLSMAFDPGGALVTAWQGTLTVRDGMPPSTLALEEAATVPAISPDGAQLAYLAVDAGRGPGATQPAGNALRIRSFSAAQRTVGPPIELVRDGGGLVGPAFSSDGQWIAVGHCAITDGRITELANRVSAIRTDGSASVDLTSDPRDRLARFVSPADGDLAWVAVISSRPVGGATVATPQLWLEAFFPGRGTVAPAFHLPNQDALALLHGPLELR